MKLFLKLFLLGVCSSDDLSSSSTDSDSVDADFHELEHEPEAWSVSVDKPLLQTMSARDIKRQDHIWGQSAPRMRTHTQINRDSLAFV